MTQTIRTAIATCLLITGMAYGKQPKKGNMAIIVSGGVSLGAYQAGLLYYATETTKLNSDFDMKIFTGTSAGSVNSFLSVLETCGRPQTPDPEKSLFWETWIPNGLDQLIVAGDMTHDNIFSRRSLQQALENVRSLWEGGLPKTCDVVLGVSATRKFPKRISVTPDFSVMRTSEHFAIHIQGQGPNRLPKVSNFFFGNPNKKQVYVIYPPDPSETLDTIGSLLFASSAFPLAFPPVKIANCLLNQREFKLGCSPDEIEEDLFIDGGLFDNWPIRKAFQLSEAFLENERDSMIFGYLDINATAFPTEDEIVKEDEGSVIDNGVQLFSYVFSQARQSELYNFLIENPRLGQQIISTKSYFPRASEPLEGFFGFLEKDFRRFDFIMGMYDGMRLTRDTKPSPKHRPEDVYKGKAWSRLKCFDGFIQKGQMGDDCVGRSDEIDGNLQALYRVAIKKLYNFCLRMKKNYQTKHRICQRAVRREPLIDGQVPWLPTDVMQIDESDVNYTIRLLVQEGFQFKDLKIEESSDVLDSLKRRFYGALSEYTLTQPDEVADVVDVVRLPLIQSIQYTPVNSFIYGELGTQASAGFSGKLGSSRFPWLRWNLRLVVDGLPWTADKPGAYALAPAVGLAWEPASLTGRLFQLRIGYDLAYRFPSSDESERSKCLDDPKRTYHCYGLMALPHATLSFIERLRLSMGWTHTPSNEPLRSARAYFALGYQQYFP
ncbi:patatin-like phospholipase family protein [Pseudobacteriovorax antillogorgiicola]|uniref:Patatin-like phospholipase n=1 Tax=Pseudobacteriovorax antillogorgiicola TaxID=1513793 RepID=A0A1Y6BM49_9BACT|nr:patatin-like phospholipase family protein [Pseudobacteriovorax antillogorgiicola]TCS54498.1 patatin-like phospholipase [Pseudobacteriovorax antillogorgiicola]SMF19042.1 Patatin-like phospholipase [Pseudobacteriovorax antillogorgiicola]